VRLLRLLAVLLAGLGSQPAVAASPVLVVTAGGATRQFTDDDLLAWHDAATLAIPHDPSYGRAMSYRAVPLSALLSALPPDAADTIQARATDGFVAVDVVGFVDFGTHGAFDAHRTTRPR